MSYEDLDKIADSYIPLLALFALITAFIPLGFSKTSICVIAHKFIRLLGVVLLVYALMYLDNYFSIFPSVGLDYSTHTALSLVLTFFLSWIHNKFRIYLISVFVAYLILMLYQQYHTVADIIATSLVVYPFAFLAFRNWGKSKACEI